MKRLSVLPALLLCLVLFSCNNNKQQNSNLTSDTLATSNPLLSPSQLPYGVPDFSKIKDADFKPALEEGIKEAMAEVSKIADNPEAPTFDNTLVALEKSGQTLDRANNAFDLLTGANTDSVLQQVQEEIAPKLAALHDATYLNSKLYERVQAIYNDRENLNLDPESRRLVEYYQKEFVKAGANLSDDDKAKLKKMNEELASLNAKFTNQLLAAAKAGALVVDDKSQLAGLPDNALEAAASDAKARNIQGKWLIPLQNTTQQPDLVYLSDRDTRHKLFEASWTRAEKGDKNDTRATIKRMAKLRAEKAKLLGFQNYASWNLQDQMAKTPESGRRFYGQTRTRRYGQRTQGSSGHPVAYR